LRRQPFYFFIGAAVEDNQEAEAALKSFALSAQEFLVAPGGLFSSSLQKRKSGEGFPNCPSPGYSLRSKPSMRCVRIETTGRTTEVNISKVRITRMTRISQSHSNPQSEADLLQTRCDGGCRNIDQQTKRHQIKNRSQVMTVSPVISPPQRTTELTE